MRVRSMLQSFLLPYKKLDSSGKKNFIFLTSSYFFVLMSYPVIRSSTDAFFIQSHGAKNWPWVTFYSVIVLSICISIFSKLQQKFGSRKVYILASLFTALFFILQAFAWESHWHSFAYLSYIWKESYIVILVHLCLAFFNANFKYEFAKSFFGLFGALTSVGGIIGGAFTSFLTKEIGVFWLMVSGAMICIFSPIFFFFLTERNWDREESEEIDSDHDGDGDGYGKSPLESVKGLWSYLGSIIGIIFITQFIINVMNFKFSIVVQDNFASMADKTVFFGKVYGLINVITLVIHVIGTPFLLRNLSLRNNHFLVLGVYFMGLLMVFTLGGQAVLFISVIFMTYKAIDYSFFSAIKEMLYYPLGKYQKYGAKYIVDMVMYRASKGVVSLFLTQVQNFSVLSGMLFSSIFIWIFLTLKVFDRRKKLLEK